MRKFILIAPLILIGCSNVGNVVPVSGNTYTVTSSGNYMPWSELKELSINKANDFCANQNKHMVVIGSETHGCERMVTAKNQNLLSNV